jgi:tRNA pseudouridine13 synthase
MKTLEFSLKLKEKPEDFIVKEIANFEKGENFYLYFLVKRNFNLFDIKLNFNFAGIKDKRALTFQYVSTDKYLGNKFFIDNFKKRLRDKKPWYYLKYLGKINKKIRPGFLKGNKFWIKTELNKLQIKEHFINYYDLQRLKDNWEEGLFLLKNKELKKLRNPIKKFKIDAFLSYIWNKSLEEYLKEKYKGYFLKEKNFYFFIPETFEINQEIKYWPILGYKIIKNLNFEKEYYQKILEKFDLDLEELQKKLKQLKWKGDYRKVFVKVEEIKIANNYISFFLPKGSYATMYLKFCFTL